MSLLLNCRHRSRESVPTHFFLPRTRILLGRWNSLSSIRLRALDLRDRDQARRLLIMKTYRHLLRRYTGTHTHVAKGLFHVTLPHYQSMYSSERMKNSLGDWKPRTTVGLLRHLQRRTREWTPTHQRVYLCLVTQTSLVGKQVRAGAVGNHEFVIVIDPFFRSGCESLGIRRDSIATRSTGTSQFGTVPRTTFQPQPRSSKYPSSEYPIAIAENQSQTKVPDYNIVSGGSGSSRTLSYFPTASTRSRDT